MHGQTLKEPSVHCFNKHNIYITLYRNRFVAQMGEECRTVGTHPRSLDLQILHFLYSRQWQQNRPHIPLPYVQRYYMYSVYMGHIQSHKRNASIMAISRQLRSEGKEKKHLKTSWGFEPITFWILVRHSYWLNYLAQMAAECKIVGTHPRNKLKAASWRWRDSTVRCGEQPKLYSHHQNPPKSRFKSWLEWWRVDN